MRVVTSSWLAQLNLAWLNAMENVKSLLFLQFVIVWIEHVATH